MLDSKLTEVAALRRGEMAALRRRNPPTLGELVDEFLGQYNAEKNTMRGLRERLAYATRGPKRDEAAFAARSPTNSTGVSAVISFRDLAATGCDLHPRRDDQSSLSRFPLERAWRILVSMANLRPEDLDISTLPRTRLGHLQEDAVADLLQRAAWSYREALAEGQQLARTVEELTARFEDLSAQVASLEESAIRRKEPDELALSLLAAAQRSAREARESARRESELILKKAARRAGRLEKDAARRTEHSRAELARLEKLREKVAERLRERLETIVALHSGEAESGSTPEETRVQVGTQP